MAVVCGVMAAAIRSGSRFRVSGSMSTKIGLIPFQSRQCEVATKEYGVVMTSPVMRSSCSAHTSAMVALLNSEISGTPSRSRSAVSNRWWNCPPLVRNLLSQISSR